MLISRCRLPLIIATFTLANVSLTAPVHAGELLVAGTLGEVYSGDPQTGGFAYWGGICLAPVHSLAFDEAHVYAGDLNGGVLRLDRYTGMFLDLYWVPGDATDLVTHGGDLLASSSFNQVHRVNRMTGLLVATLESPITIQAMAVNGDDLFIAGTLGEVYKGNAYTGNFQQFGTACLGQVQALALDETSIYAGDETGAVLRFDLATGAGLGIFTTVGTITAMVVDGGDLLVSEISGVIRRYDPTTGALLSTLTSPIAVDAMDMLPACPADIAPAGGDGVVNVLDLIDLLLCFGQPATPPCDTSDISGDGTVNVLDLIALLLVFGQTCP